MEAWSILVVLTGTRRSRAGQHFSRAPRIVSFPHLSFASPSSFCSSSSYLIPQGKSSQEGADSRSPSLHSFASVLSLISDLLRAHYDVFFCSWRPSFMAVPGLLRVA